MWGPIGSAGCIGELCLDQCGQCEPVHDEQGGIPTGWCPTHVSVVLHGLWGGQEAASAQSEHPRSDHTSVFFRRTNG